ncbi:MAG: type I-C CRISPR-associated protein Cas8c/Csd1 [Methylomicrobium sp.]
MLNELYALSAVLDTTGVKTEIWHKNFVPNPKTATFRILVDDEGNIADIETITDEKAKTAIRKWETSNGNSFPSFNVTPLYDLTQDTALIEQAKELKKQLDKDKLINVEHLKTLIEQAANLWVGQKKIAKCLFQIPQEMGKLIAESTDENQALFSLTQRILKTNPRQFHQQLTHCLLHQEKLLPFFELLFFYTGAKPKNTCLVLEVVDRLKFEYPANHPKAQAWFNQCLLAGGKSEATSSDKDAYGVVNNGWQEKFGAIRMNILGDVTLRAMNDESRCQYRYGQINSTGNPVGIQAREAMSSSLAWLSDPDRKRKTWTDVSRSKGESALLFAYPSAMPEEEAEYAQLMGGTVDEDGAKFEACAKLVVKSLSQIPKTIEAQMQIFVLSKPDGFRTKVQFNHNCSIDHFIQSAQDWQIGCRNLPPLAIRTFGEDKKPSWSEPLTPYPEEIVWCLNTVWTHFGTQASLIKQFNMGDALDLLLDSGLKLTHTAKALLAAILKNNQSFMLALGNAHHVGRVHIIPKSYNKQALLLPSILALLLDKSNLRNEDYMKSPAYLIGRLFSVADQLHDKYCKYVRKDSKPPQLLGNALMAIALEHPKQALAMFSQRMLPYQAWARTYSDPNPEKEAGLVHFFLNEWGAICNQLAELEEIPELCRDTDKAAMLLGYLASNGKKDQSELPASGESNESK